MSEAYEITTIDAKRVSFDELQDGIPGVLTRVQTTPTAGWMLLGRPVEEWEELARAESRAVDYLARKIAQAEGLTERAYFERCADLEDEARAFASKDRG